MANGYTYQAILKNKDNKPLANKKVLITINGKKQVAYTDEKGYVTVKFTVNKEGTYRVDLKFAGDRYCNAISDYRTINVIKQPTTVSASPVAYRVDAKPKQVTATLKSSYGNVIRSGKITLNVNGAYYTAFTDTNGIAIFSIDLAQKGVYTAVATFGGSDYYKKSSSSTKITIN